MPFRLNAAGALAAMLAAGGCSDWFSSDDALYTGPSGVTLRADETFPSIASVPDRPATRSTEEERAAALAESRPLGPAVTSQPVQTAPLQTAPAASVPQPAVPVPAAVSQPSFTPPPPMPQSLAPQSFAPQLPQGPVLVATINFVTGSDNLDARDRDILRNVVTMIGQSGRSVTVVGHASAQTAVMDPNRARAINYDLSVQRATAVARALVNLGAPAGQVLVYAVGDNQPVFHEWMQTGEVGNQRAEIFLN
ncbi:MAG: OmpA family protein [Alphaproteobacteria bacterium]